jgi:hypothetical protein
MGIHYEYLTSHLIPATDSIQCIGRLNDVWRSTDSGSSWSFVTSASWSARAGHSSVALNSNTIVLTGGYDGDSK